jgi:hypothetical protein
MPTPVPRKDRRHDRRPGFRVKHRHRVGSAVVERISEMVYVKGRPVALLDWVDLGGIRTPLYVCELDPTKLRPATEQRGVFHYEGVTTDPRFLDALNPPSIPD